ncbi:D-alanyl-D-alanine carboxypeptidase family protein [Cohnella terricola]|uniref:D-alanyl-D-alanine carboxypeptidase n=1 Tax=Cohnella terricola TaxID=1289167 RepID=A0A559JX68_9BACL|nr:D-alanyl-D-alanine carboxypeptidase family protein [Cohnella terricola]TVY04482.1 D-alanyl-D-alanine carboxypeptidase [Cohnella terricola]
MRLKRLLIAVAIVFIVGWAVNANGKLGLTKPKEPALAVVSAVMMDVDTGKWLYRSNAAKPLPPASMSKMMTEVLVLDSVNSGNIAWNDTTAASTYASRVGGAKMGLTEGQIVTVKELFEAMAVHSANDASVALAELIAGTETEFVKRMNAKAEVIGLSKASRFANATGLSSSDLRDIKTAAAKGETMMTAEDVALLAKYLIETYPEVLQTTKKAEAGYANVKLQTTNEMLPGQRFGTRGNDGLKTGYTERAGYCFTGTTVSGGRRYITVVMGASTPEARFEETKKLLAYAEGSST